MNIEIENAGDGFFDLKGDVVAKLKKNTLFFLVLGWRRGNGVLTDERTQEVKGFRIHREDWLDFLREAGADPAQLDRARGAFAPAAEREQIREGRSPRDRYPEAECGGTG